MVYFITMGNNSEMPHQDTRPPFEIRGHHTYAGPFGVDSELFLHGTPNPEQILEYTMDFVDIERAGRSHRDPDTAAYSKDLIGEQPHETFEFIRKNLLIMTRFASFPEDYPIVITQEPDEICRTCAIGAHCHTHRIQEEDGDFLTRLYDCLVEMETEGIHLEEQPSGLKKLRLNKKQYIDGLIYYRDTKILPSLSLEDDTI